MTRQRTMYVDLAAGPDDEDRFLVYVRGSIMAMSLADIKAAVERGDKLEEWEHRPAP